MIEFPLPVLGFAAWSGTGKTTLLSQLIPLLSAKGLRVALVKHAHHSFDIDHPGKDSHTLRKAGAEMVVIASKHRIACVRETPESQEEPALKALLAMIDTENIDLVLVEGFKTEDIPKVELHRACLNKPYLYPNDSNIIALAQDSDMTELHCACERLDLGCPQQIADFIERFIQKRLKLVEGCRQGQPRLCNA